MDKATEGIRTLDLAFTKRLLCQLSYGGGLTCGPNYTREELDSQVKKVQLR